jgi:hypothetical protein
VLDHVVLAVAVAFAVEELVVALVLVVWVHPVLVHHLVVAAAAAVAAVSHPFHISLSGSSKYPGQSRPLAIALLIAQVSFVGRALHQSLSVAHKQWSLVVLMLELLHIRVVIELAVHVLGQ